jgi:hypothetical protein
MRLLVEAGVVPPALVPARPLPPGVRPAVRKLYAGFQRLLGCKWLLKPGEPTAFAYRFAGAWCGVSLPYVSASLTWLLQQGYLRQVGKHKGMALYQLGEGRDGYGGREEEPDDRGGGLRGRWRMPKR